MSIFGCTASAADLTALLNFHHKWDDVRDNMPRDEAGNCLSNAAQKAEWDSDMVALSETVRAKIREGMRNEHSEQPDLQGFVEDAMHEAANWDVLIEIEVLISHSYLPQVDAFLAKWKGVQEQSSSDETRASWASDVQALLDLYLFGSSLCNDYAALSNKISDVDYNDYDKRMQVSRLLMKTTIDFAGVSECIDSWRKTYIARL
jgi:hypothetical protein